mgnify:CR=1 FL=1
MEAEVAYCEHCGDGFNADESSDGRFCSWNCREEYEELEQHSDDYDLGYGPSAGHRLKEIREAEFLDT